MIVLIDAHSGVPVYRQVMDQIRFQVESGRLCPGDELPSTRTLSTTLGVNPMTVSKAFGLLEQEGILTRRPGLPLVVSERREAEREQERLRRLQAALLPAARLARELDVSADSAMQLFGRMLEENRINEESVR